MSKAERFSLKPAIAAEQREYTTSEGVGLNYYVDDAQPGVPLLLIHSINAAPSAMEMRPLFDHYRQHRPVFALELPGFGFSQRGDLPYSNTLFSNAIVEFVGQVLMQAPEAQAPDIVALSLSSEFVAQGRVEQAMACRSLVLISPTGIGRRPPPDPAVGARVLSVLHKPLLGKALWRGLTSRASIRWFLGQAFHGKAPEALIDYAWETAHQPDAQYAPFAFLSMRLFTREAVDRLYARLDVPTLVIYDRDPNIDFDRLPELERLQPLVRSQKLAPSRGLPQWEHPARTVTAIDQFWDD